MAQMEPMDIDSINCEFDNKENSLQHSNVLSHAPCTEKGYEELDVSELNMKLRYSITPASSPMSKSFTAHSLDNRTFDSESYINNVVNSENCSLTHSLNSTITKNDQTKVLKSLPLQVLSNETVNDSRNGSILQTLDTTYKAQDSNVTITLSGDDFIDDNLSVPSTSSSCAQTPEATTPTKDTLKHDGSSPIMRGLKSVLNMFRSSQSPIPPSESDNTDKVSSAPVLNKGSNSQLVTASTPISKKQREVGGSQRSSPLKESIVFNDDLERELQWKDETTILFKEEKIPIHKLLLPQSISALSKPSDSVTCSPKLEKVNNNITIENMGISTNNSFVDMECAKPFPNTNTIDLIEPLINESDGEFVDCETSINNESIETKMLENLPSCIQSENTSAELTCKNNLKGCQTINIELSNDILLEYPKEIDLKSICDIIKECNDNDTHANTVEYLDINLEHNKVISNSIKEIDNCNTKEKIVLNATPILESNLAENVGGDHHMSPIGTSEEFFIKDNPKIEGVSQLELPSDIPLPHEDEMENKITIEDNDLFHICNPSQNIFGHINEEETLERELREGERTEHLLCIDKERDKEVINCTDTTEMALNTINKIVSENIDLNDDIYDNLLYQSRNVNESVKSRNTDEIEKYDDVKVHMININELNSVTQTILELNLQTDGLIETEILKQNDENPTDFKAVIENESSTFNKETLVATETNEKVDVSNANVIEFTAESNVENESVGTLSTEIHTCVNTHPENIELYTSNTIEADESNTIDFNDKKEESVSIDVCKIEEGPKNNIPNKGPDCAFVFNTNPNNYAENTGIIPIENSCNAITNMDVNTMDVEMLEICDDHKSCSGNVEKEQIMDCNDDLKRKKYIEGLPKSDNDITHINYNDITMQEINTTINMSVSHDEAIQDKSIQDNTRVKCSKAYVKSNEDIDVKQSEIVQTVPSFDTYKNNKSQINEIASDSNLLDKQSIIDDVVAVSKDTHDGHVWSSKEENVDTPANQIFKNKNDISDTMKVSDIIKTKVNIDFEQTKSENNLILMEDEVLKQNNDLKGSKRTDHDNEIVEKPTEKSLPNINDIVVLDIADKEIEKNGGEGDCLKSEDKLHVSPPSSPKISSKGYNFNFDEIDDPFATKTKIRVSPSPDGSQKSNTNNVNRKKATNINKDFQKRKSLPPNVQRSSVNKKINSTFGEAVNYEKVSKCHEAAVIREPFAQEREVIDNSNAKLTDSENILTCTLPEDIKSSEIVKLSELSEEIKAEEKLFDQNLLAAKCDTITIESNYSEHKMDPDNNYEPKNVFNIPEMSSDMGLNLFVTKNRVCRTPSPDLKVSSHLNETKTHDCGNVSEAVNTINFNNYAADNESKLQIATKVEHDSSTTSSSSKATEDATIREVNTEDEDTVEGPFFESDDINDDGKTSDPVEDNDDMMNFNDIQAQGADANLDNGEIFIDAEAFEFLLNQNKCNVVADSGKESLFLKFDPLFAKRISSDGVLAALNKVNKRQSTPKRVSKAPTIDVTYSDQMPREPSNLNVTTDGNSPLENNFEDLNTTVSKPMMVVNPAINSIISPRSRSIVTPPRANRRSLTFTSPAMAVIDRLLSLSGNSATLNHETPTPQVRREQNQTDLALTQLRELLAEKEIHVHNLRLESKELKERLSSLESQVKSLESESEHRLKKVNELNERLIEKTNINKSMAVVVEEYERTIASLIAETEQDKKRHAEERMRLINERDEQTAHLASMEISFNDLHSKYEKSKQVILSCKANEDAYKRSVKEFEESLLKMQNNYELLKQHATSKLNHANQELEKLNRAHEAEVLKLGAMIKRKDLHITSLEESLAQKTKANEELTAICDELINKVG